MTRGDIQNAATRVVEDVWFKGAARVSAMVLVLLGVPLVLAVTKRTYEAINSIDLIQAQLGARIALIEQATNNDRKAGAERDAQLYSFIEKITNSFVRSAEVTAGFGIRDQRLENIEHRLDTIEKRLDKQ